MLHTCRKGCIGSPQCNVAAHEQQHNAYRPQKHGQSPKLMSAKEMEDAMSLDSEVWTILKIMNCKRFGHGSGEAANTNGALLDHPSDGETLNLNGLRNSYKDGKRKVTRPSMVAYFTRSVSLDAIGVLHLATPADVQRSKRDLNKWRYSFNGTINPSGRGGGGLIWKTSDWILDCSEVVSCIMPLTFFD